MKRSAHRLKNLCATAAAHRYEKKNVIKLDVFMVSAQSWILEPIWGVMFLKINWFLLNIYSISMNYFFLAKSIFRSVLDDFLIKIGSIWKLPGCQFWGIFSLNFICFMCICSFYHKSENRGCQRGATNRYFLPPQSCRGQLISQPKGRGMISRIARA